MGHMQVHIASDDLELQLSSLDSKISSSTPQLLFSDSFSQMPVSLQRTSNTKFIHSGSTKLVSNGICIITDKYLKDMGRLGTSWTVKPVRHPKS